MLKKIHYWPVNILLISFLLSACSSIPLSTMVKLSSFDEQQLTLLNVADIRAKITINQFINLDLENTNMGISIENDSGEMQLAFPLKVLSVTQNPAQTGFLSKKNASQTFLLKLSAAGEKDFKKLQQQLQQPKKSKIGFSVDAKLKKNKELTPEQQAQTIVMTIEMKINNQDGFFTLFDEYELKESKTEL